MSLKTESSIREARRFAGRLAAATAATWTAGVIALTLLIGWLTWTATEVQADLELRARGLAAYGLGWFDVDGRFHDELLEKEEGLLDGGYGVAVMGPEGLAYSSHGFAAFEGLESLAARVMAGEEELMVNLELRGRPPLRAMALPTYDDDDVMVGAVIAVADPSGPRQAWAARMAKIGVLSLGFVLLGFGASWALARRLVGRLEQDLRDREALLASAAHELRTPIGRLEAIAASGLAGDEPAARALERVAGTTTQARHLVEGLLIWSRLSEVEPAREPVRVDLLLETLLEEGEPAALGPRVLELDPRLTCVLFENLLRNARTHGLGVARVTLDAAGLCIEDSGLGFDPSPARALTEPFIKGADSKGHGLGLTLADRIAQLHGWRLELGPGPQVRVVFKA